MYEHLRPLLKTWSALQFGPDGTLKKEWFKNYEFSIWGGHRSYDMTKIDVPDGSFDLIASNHVIEHVSDDLLALRECLRVVGPSGLVHITAPSPGYRFKTEDWGFPDPALYEHYREYGADIGKVLAKADDGVHGMAVAGIDPVTLTSDTVFFFSRLGDAWEARLFRCSAPTIHASYFEPRSKLP